MGAAGSAEVGLKRPRDACCGISSFSLGEPPAKKRDLTLPENLMIEAEDKEALVQAHNEMDERLKAFEGGKRKSATELKELRASANLDKAEAAAVAPESPTTSKLDAKLSKAKSRSEPLKRMSSYRTTG